MIVAVTEGVQTFRPTFNRAFLLEPNELLGLLPVLRVVRYQEVDTGLTEYSSILAKKEH